MPEGRRSARGGRSRGPREGLGEDCAPPPRWDSQIGEQGPGSDLEAQRGPPRRQGQALRDAAGRPEAGSDVWSGPLGLVPSRQLTTQIGTKRQVTGPPVAIFPLGLGLDGGRHRDQATAARTASSLAAGGR